MIYFLQAEDSEDGRIKIGHTSDYHGRLNGLSAEYGKLKLLGVMDGSRLVEKALHLQFVDSRIDPRREWFRPTKDLLDFIEANSTLSVPRQKTMIKISEDTAGALYALAGSIQMETRKPTSLDDALQWLLKHRNQP